MPPFLQIYGLLLVNLQLILLIDCPRNYFIIHRHMKKKLVSHPDTIYLELFVVSVTHGLDLTPPISLSLGPFHVFISASLKFIMCTNVLIPFTQNFMCHSILSFLKIFSPFKL